MVDAVYSHFLTLSIKMGSLLGPRIRSLLYSNWLDSKSHEPSFPHVPHTVIRRKFVFMWVLEHEFRQTYLRCTHAYTCH